MHSDITFAIAGRDVSELVKDMVEVEEAAGVRDVSELFKDKVAAAEDPTGAKSEMEIDASVQPAAEMLVDEGVVKAEKARMDIVQGANGDKNNSNIGDAKTNVTDSEVEVAKDDGKSVKMWWRRREQTYRTAAWNASNGVCQVVSDEGHP